MAALRTTFGAISLVVVTFCGQPTAAYAGQLRKVWQLDLRKVVHRTNGLPEFPVLALRFSPDGQKLAVNADIYGTGQDRKSRLLLVGVDHPTTNVQQFEIEWGILENELGRGSALNFGWAPSGEIIYAVGKVIHLADQTTCDLPNLSVFISDEVAISAPIPTPFYSSTKVMFFDQNCHQREEWEAPESWVISDVSTDRRLLSVMSHQGITTSLSGVESLIVDPLRRKVLQRWPAEYTWGPAWEFADSGKAVCIAGNVLQSDHAPAICRNVDTGKVIAETQGNGIEPIAMATHASRGVVSDYRRRKIPFDYEYQTTFKGRYVWDFASGRKLASWYPESETSPFVSSHANQITEPFRFAISPDGQYVAEGGNGKLTLYKIEP
jgi:hypothetical protein